MDRRKTGNETRRTPHEQQAANDRDKTQQPTAVWHVDQSAPPRKCASASSPGRCLAFDQLRQEALAYVSEQVENRAVVCRAVQRLEALGRSCPVPVEHLSDLFDALRGAAGDPAFDRQAAILEHRLGPLVRQHFPVDDQAVLERALKTLVVLRTLGIPYRAPSSPAADRLVALHRLCEGDGLMTWHERVGGPVYVVERDVDRFVDWLLAREVAFLGRREREKALCNALWVALKTEEPTIDEASIGIEVAPFAEQEAVVVHPPALGQRVVVFESPWEADRGQRLHRVLQRLPEGMPVDHVWVWQPALLDPEDAQQVTCYMALARALREAGEENRAAALTLMGESYPSVSALALRAIVGCYRRGRVVTEQGMWQPNGHRGSLVSLTQYLVIWASDGEKSTQHTVNAIPD